MSMKSPAQLNFLKALKNGFGKKAGDSKDKSEDRRHDSNNLPKANRHDKLKKYMKKDK